MKIGVLKETRGGETRVAAVPETVMKYVGWGFDVMFENAAGAAAGFDDKLYSVAGADIIINRQHIFDKADIILSVWGAAEQEYNKLRAKQILIADFESFKYPRRAEVLAKTGVTALALERMPRISRAQSADILSSQSNIGGYKAAMLGMNLLNRAVPLMMTAAGTVVPAKALVLGAGVAGLQAIATLKRMGAVVYSSDVRAAAREQVESLGGRFLSVDDSADFENHTGYAAEVSAQYLAKQKLIITEQLKQTDILITTALSANGKAPELVSAAMASVMPPHAVIVDMAGGNVEAENLRDDILIISNRNLAALVPDTASKLFARNVLNLLEMYGGKNFNLPPDDEILTAIALCGYDHKESGK